MERRDFLRAGTSMSAVAGLTVLASPAWADSGVPCPERDWTSDSNDPANKQIADLIVHYEETHGDGMPQELRNLLTACAHALGGI